MATLKTLKLVCRAGPMKGQSFNVPDSKLSVGRESTCGLPIDDPKVSRIHGTFEVKDGALYFRDNNSTNGTYLNGTKIKYEMIKLGDVLQFGSCEIALLQQSDLRSIQFVSDDSSMVTNVISTQSLLGDALAQKFGQIFEYYKDHSPESSPLEQVELVKQQRMLNGIKTLYSASQRMSALVRLEDLLKIIGESLFQILAGAENLVILLWDDESRQFKPRLNRDRDGKTDRVTQVSSTVLARATKERSTIAANDAGSDSRFNKSDSIVGLEVKTVMCAPLVVGERVIGALYLDNRVQNTVYDEMDAEVVTAFANQSAIAIDNARLCDTLQESYHQTLQALINAIEAKDPYTMGHTARVRQVAVGIAHEMGFDEARLERLSMAADLHDIGKIGVCEGIINKPGALTETEYNSIKTHVEMGEKILRPIKYLSDILPFIRGHHEKWDGSGYPDGLKGEACPLEGRILCVADVFDAMTTQRSYNKPLTFQQALERIQKSAGAHFDPQVVHAFEQYVTKQLTGTKSRDTGHPALSSGHGNGEESSSAGAPRMQTARAAAE